MRIATALIVYAGGASVLNGQITPGTWYLFVQALQRFMFPLTSIASFWSQFQDGLSAAERVFSLIDAEPKVVQVAEEAVGKLEGRIEFDNTCFAYVSGEDVLCDFNLSIPPRQTVAFVGHTGAGKSSLARLIAASPRNLSGRLGHFKHEFCVSSLTGQQRLAQGFSSCSLQRVNIKPF